jgi:hypothetical protein
MLLFYLSLLRYYPVLPRASGFRFFLYLFAPILYDSLNWGSALRNSSPAEEKTQTPQIDLLLLNGIRNPDRSVGEVADRADGVKETRDIHGIRLGMRRSGFCSPRTGDRASL